MEMQGISESWDKDILQQARDGFYPEHKRTVFILYRMGQIHLVPNGTESSCTQMDRFILYRMGQIHPVPNGTDSSCTEWDRFILYTNGQIHPVHKEAAFAPYSCGDIKR
ncbi:hypothetical protein CHS0354_024427 [Potamilus streckersoni]|uniref:Uncharacterized protein n=1 Tax=Potamilus streckersoni TaxID=2493646 RepID=A0AAE0SW11_9BIVA|nr:hypothetical protein CHS0354_024427 [Potamilus streckersoni]